MFFPTAHFNFNNTSFIIIIIIIIDPETDISRSEEKFFTTLPAVSNPPLDSEERSKNETYFNFPTCLKVLYK